MKKLFFLIPALVISLVTNATVPTIIVDGDKSDWAEIPMLSEPGVWPMLKVIPAADAEMGTNALVYMMENTEDFDPTWAKYPKVFIDKDYNGSTHTIDAYWAFSAMGLEYSMTTGANVNSSWVSFPKAMSSDNKVFEIGFPATYVTDLDSKFGFAMYYNSGAWFCPDRSDAVIEAIYPANGFLYKTRTFTPVAGTTTLTTANVFAHQSMGEVGEYVDFGLRDNGYDTIRWAAFPIELTKPAVYTVTTNVTSSNGWKFEFWVVDVKTNAIVAHIDAPSSNRSSSETSYTFGKLDLSAVPAGKYMLKVKNRTAYSTVKLNSIDLTYAGGATKDIPATLIPTDAMLSPRAWVDKTGTVDSILFTPRGSEGYNSEEWAKWRVKVTDAGYYNFTAHVCRPGGSQKYEIKVLSSDETVEKISKTDESIKKGDQTISTGIVKLEEGSYVVKVRNTYNYAESRLLNVEAEYIGGAIQNMPGTTNLNEAWFSAEGTRAEGKIDFPDGHIQDGWVKWNVSFANAASYKVKVNINSENGHNYTVALYEDEDDLTPITWSEGEQKDDASPLDLGSKEVPAGNYILKVTNATQYSDAQLISVQFIYEGGAVITLPGTLTLAEAVLSPLAYKEDGTNYIHFTDDEHVSQVPDQWAKWNVQADLGVYSFTFEITSPNYGKYVITVLDDQNNPVYTHEYDKDGDGSYTTEGIILNGNYTVQMQNMQEYSKGYITSMTATKDESIFVLDEKANDGAYIAAMDGVSKKVLINRTFKGGMYNTLCIPVEPGLTGELTTVFGAGYELLEMTSAELEGNTLNLIFANASSFIAGKPYLIKPVDDVENPIIPQHGIHNYTTNHTVSCTNADFIGSFVAGEVPAGEDNLFLGPNNLLYFSETATPIKGTRAYFQLKGIPHPQQAIKHARIVKGTQVITAIDLVDADNNAVKTIENGQIIIIRDGIRYNVMGVKLQ